MDTPIYDELARKHGVHIPDPLDSEPLSTLLPVSDAANPTMALPAVQAVVEVGGVDTGLLERIDGWCEDRDPDELGAA